MLSISFIIPLYNGQNYIKRCIKSILSLRDISGELIIINDGSTDKSMEIVNRAIIAYNKHNFNIIIENQPNSGVAAARNRGITLATKEFLSFVDQDDFLLPNFVSIFDKQDFSEYDMIIGGYCRKAKSNTTTKKFVPTNADFSKYCLTYPWGRLIRRQFLLTNHISFLKTGIGEDIYFNLVAYSYTSRIKMIQDYAYVWYINEQSVSNTEYVYINSKTDSIQTFDAILQDISKDFCDQKRYVEYYFIKYIVWFLLSNAQKSDYKMLITERNRLFTWLKLHYPDYQHNPSLNPLRPKGDSFVNKISVSIYFLLYRLHMDWILLKLL